jgi:hypothetical protein
VFWVSICHPSNRYQYSAMLAVDWQIHRARFPFHPIDDSGALQ